MEKLSEIDIYEMDWKFISGEILKKSFFSYFLPFFIEMSKFYLIYKYDIFYQSVPILAITTA